MRLKNYGLECFCDWLKTPAGSHNQYCVAGSGWQTVAELEVRCKAQVFSP